MTLNNLVKLTVCNLSPQNTTDGGFICTYDVPAYVWCTGLCTAPDATETQALLDLAASFDPSGWTGFPTCSSPWPGVTV